MNERDLNRLEEHELVNEIGALEQLRGSQGWQMLQGMLAQLLANRRDKLEGAALSDSRADLAFVQGEASILRLLIEEPHDSDDDDEPSDMVGVMLDARREVLKKKRDAREAQEPRYVDLPAGTILSDQQGNAVGFALGSGRGSRVPY